MKKRALSIALSLIMLTSMLPCVAVSEENGSDTEVVVQEQTQNPSGESAEEKLNTDSTDNKEKTETLNPEQGGADNAVPSTTSSQSDEKEGEAIDTDCEIVENISGNDSMDDGKSDSKGTENTGADVKNDLVESTDAKNESTSTENNDNTPPVAVKTITRGRNWA